MTAVKYRIGDKPWVLSGDTDRGTLESIGSRLSQEIEMSLTFHRADYEKAYDAFVAMSKRGVDILDARVYDQTAINRFRTIISKVFGSAVEDEGKAIRALRFVPLLTPASH